MRLEAEWLDAENLREVIAALGGETYFVGGCVRNTLLGEPVSDIDLTTPTRPDEVARRLEAAGITVKPTGIEHGTVMAIVGHQGFEVTTFRADVSTDGRRATVRFSDDIAEDAARRDFTMNAVYARPDGEIVDPLGGLPDLLARRVRFIGAAEARIREDYLRILRFFRFSAWYGGENGIEAWGLAACAALADGIDGLARERIGAEVKKLLGAPDPAPAVAAMAASGILMRCLPGADPALLAPLVHVEGLAGAAPDWRARLVALGGEDPAGRLRLSRAEARDLEAIRGALAEPRPPAEAAHLLGPDVARTAALIRAAGSAERDGLDGLEAELARGAAAEFPLKAEDLIAAGMRPGPGLGQALNQARNAWLESGFTLDRAALVGAAMEGGEV